MATKEFDPFQYGKKVEEEQAFDPSQFGTQVEDAGSIPNSEPPGLPKLPDFFSLLSQDSSDNAVKRFGRGLVEPVVRTVSRPVQLIQSLATGRTPEYNIPSLLGNIRVPNPSNQEQPVKGALGEALQTIALGLGPVAGGATFAGGSALAGGESIPQAILKAGIGAVTGKGTEAVLNKTSPYLLKRASEVYQSALKPSLSKKNIGKIPGVIQTGLNEGIVLSEAGVQKTASTIDNLEMQLGDAIDKAAGITRDVEGNVVSTTGKPAIIQTSSLRAFVDEAKKFLGKTTDVNFSKNAINQIDALYTSFAKKYGEEIPVDVAQELKTNTYRWLKDAYGELSSPIKEGNKQLVRGLKEGIVDIAPIAGDINKRLKRLYEFDEALSRAAGRIGNLNLLGLGTKVLLGGGKLGTALSIANELFGPAGKSFSAIEMNKLGQALQKISPEARRLIQKGIQGLQGQTNSEQMQ